ncbi:hypothetical protein [Arthrobacter methylotrophus]|uniref:GerMN domain-containing protein n=1 Tax=Arthrobacter methylotrophus TaxID=121291 RepID=A0ABV5UK66_9MICC
MARRRLAAFSVLGACALFALSACFGPSAPAPTSSSSTPSATATPVATLSATASPSAPSSPSIEPTPTSPAATTPTGLPEQVAPLTVYYVAIGDNGTSGPMIGCGDSLVATTTAPVSFTDQVGPSIRTLLANKSRAVGMSGLVNVLYQSNLTYLGGELDGSTITIYLSGQFMLSGVCDIPRAKAQLEYTAMAASAATSARVFVNGRPIDDVLSLK